MFPVPLPAFLSDAIEMHRTIAYLGGGLLGFFGIILIVLWTPGYKSGGASWQKTARDRIQGGFLFLFLAILSVAFGFYLWSILMLFVIAFILWAVIRGIQIAFGKEDAG